MEFFCWFLQGYLIVCIARIIFSFLQVNDDSIIGSFATVAYTLTEPVFAPIRRALPTPGDLPLDFSPLVVTFLLGFLIQIFC